MSRTGFEIRSTILPLHRSRPLGKFPTTISYRNWVKASHGGSSLSRTGSSPSRTGLFLASLRGASHGPSLSRTGFELRSTILPLHQTYQPFLTEMGLGLRMEGPHRAGQACFISTKLFRIRFLLLCLVWLLRLVLIGRSLRLF